MSSRKTGKAISGAVKPSRPAWFGVRLHVVERDEDAEDRRSWESQRADLGVDGQAAEREFGQRAFRRHVRVADESGRASGLETAQRGRQSDSQPPEPENMSTLYDSVIDVDVGVPARLGVAGFALRSCSKPGSFSISSLVTADAGSDMAAKATARASERKRSAAALEQLDARPPRHVLISGDLPLVALLLLVLAASSSCFLFACFFRQVTFPDAPRFVPAL